MGKFLTPPSLPPDTYCRRLLIPNSPQWIGTVSGALRELIFPSAWTEITGITAEQAAERAEVMYRLFLNSGNGGECEDMACCDDRIIMKRYDPDTGRPQISINGGDWQPDPDDPQYAIPQLPPAISSGVSNTKCDAATNALERIKDIISETSSNIATASSVYELAVIITGAVLAAVVLALSGGTLSPVAVTITTIIWGAGSAAFTAGQAAFDDYWSSENLDIMLCALLDNIGENGAFTEEQYQGWRSQAKFDLPSSPARDLVMTAINAVGAPGLSNMAANGTAADADCEDCEETTCWNGWEAVIPTGGSDVWGTVVSKVGNVMTVQGTEVAPGLFRAMIGNVSNSNCRAYSTSGIVGTIAAGECGVNNLNMPNDSGLWKTVGVNSNMIFLAENGANFTVTVTCEE